MNILVIFTGGTIGSTLQNGSISTDSTSSFALIDTYQKSIDGDDLSFTTTAPLNILSENLTPFHWTTIIESIESFSLSDFDGIILTHGTDTLSYTANALALYFKHIQIPLVMVSSHLPLLDPKTNGHINFSAAINFIKEQMAGVFVAYKNPHEEFVSIFHGHQIIQSPQLSSRFDCLSHLTASLFQNKVTLLNKGPEPSFQDSRLLPHFCENFLWISSSPALNYDLLELEKIDVILQSLYHSGTCDETKLKPFIRRCKRENTLLFLVGIAQQESYYETTQSLIDMGVPIFFDISIEHAYVKLMFALANFTDEEALLEYLKI